MAYFITQPRILFVLRANDRKHSGLLKIGDIFVDAEVAEEYQEMDMLSDLVKEKLNQKVWAKELNYEVLLAVCTTYNSVTGIDCFKSKDIIDILSDSGYAPQYLKSQEKKIDLWMPVTLPQVKEAIAAASHGHKTIEGKPEPQVTIQRT